MQKADQMHKEILMDFGDEEVSIALLENGKLAEIYLERLSKQRLMGNIYKGRVENVLPGMQAAFVDIGLERNSFLHVEDALPKPCQNGTIPPWKEICISQVLKTGDQIMVQISKEPVGTKGARVTTNITLPGRYLVLMPTGHYVAVSRRIEDEAECQRLKDLMQELLPADKGVIIRTVANGVDREELAADLKSLMRQWQRILGKAAKANAPALIHRDLDLIHRVLRDTDYQQIQRLTVNNQEGKEKLEEILRAGPVPLNPKISVNTEGDLFARHNIYGQLKEALQRRVWLKSGGYLVFDQVEAFTIIDVNTGKYVGETNLSDTVSKTNLEAVKEISRQLRLRNIGGIIIVDFIDMESPEDKARLLEFLEEELKKDRNRVTVLGMTQLGLVEMTRKKLGHELAYVLEQECPHCHGKGQVFSPEAMARWISMLIPGEVQNTQAPALLIKASQSLAAYLNGAGKGRLKSWEEKWGKKLQVEGVNGIPIHDVTIRPLEEKVQKKG